MYQSDPETKRNAELENKLLLDQGVPYFEPLPTDNHKSHNEHHMKEINRPERRQYLLFNREVLKKLTDHMNAHHKQIPTEQPPPPAARVNVNVSQLMKSLLEYNPQAAQELLPIVQQLTGAAVGQAETVNNEAPPTGKDTRAPAGNLPGGAGAGIPPGASEDKFV